jgi:putative hemolysin
VLIAMALCAGFAASETIFLTIDRIRLHTRDAINDRSARLIKFFTDYPVRFMVTILVGINAAEVLYASFLAIYLEHLGFPESVGLIVSPLLLLVVSETIPKALARQSAEQLSGIGAHGLYYFRLSIKPLILAVEKSVTVLQSRLGLEDRPVGIALTRSDLTYAISAASLEGGVSREEEKLIRRLFEFGNRMVEDVMTPRNRVTSISVNEEIRTAVDLILATKHKRIVCYGETEDDVLGVIDATDLVSNPLDLRSVVHQVPFVPGSLPAVRLLDNMRLAKSHFVIVIDEYGGFAGIVTLYDLATEVIGPIREGHIDTSDDCWRLSPTVWMASGRMKLHLLAEITGYIPPTTHANTLAGLIIELADRIPQAGAEFSTPGGRLRVLRSDGRSIQSVKIALPEVEESLPIS